MKLLAFFFVFICTGFARETIKEFEEEFHELWSDPEQEAEEAKVLEKVEDEIEEHNKLFEKGESSYKEGLNEMSVLSKEEQLTYKTGVLSVERGYSTGLLETPGSEKILSPEKQKRLDEIYKEIDFAEAQDRWYHATWGTLPSAPDQFDARQQGWVTPAKDQGFCASCVAFATQAAVEVCMAKAGYKNLDLSEQQALDCGIGDLAFGCNGAYLHAYAVWVQEHMSSGGKVSSENAYPYQALNTKNQCQSRPTVEIGSQVSETVADDSCNEEKLRKLVARYGAVVTGVNGDAINSYKSGIFDGCTENYVNHAVTVVGYTADHWIVKNSWGTNYGENGYIRIKKGVGMCGIGSICVAMDCTGTPTARNEDEIQMDNDDDEEQEVAASTCDVSNLYDRKDINGNYTLISKVSNVEFVAEVICTDSICQPKYPGPMDACMYICGKKQC